MAILDEIKGRVQTASEIPGAVVGAIKAGITNRRVTNEAISTLTNKIGSGNIVGQENYNKHYARVKELLKSGKGTELRDYVNSQKAKVDQQVKAEKEAKAKNRKEILINKFKK